MSGLNEEKILQVFFDTWHIPIGIFNDDSSLVRLYSHAGERLTQLYLSDSRYVLEKEAGSDSPVLRYDLKGSCWCLIPRENRTLLFGPVQTGQDPAYRYENVPEQTWKSFRDISRCLVSLICGTECILVEKEDSYTEGRIAREMLKTEKNIKDLNSFDELYDCIRSGDIELLRTLLDTGTFSRYLDRVMTDMRTARNVFYFCVAKAYHTAQETSASVQDLTAIVRMYFDEEAGYRSLAAYKAGMQRIMYDFTRYVHQIKKGRYSHTVSQALYFISENLYEPIRIDELAKYCMVSLSSLQHRFREETGMTISDMIREQKTAKACYFLKHTDLPCGDIAFRVGYSSQSYFSKQFKMTKGCTPQEYRLYSRL